MQQNVWYIFFLIKVFYILGDIALTNKSKDKKFRKIYPLLPSMKTILLMISIAFPLGIQHVQWSLDFCNSEKGLNECICDKLKNWIETIFSFQSFTQLLYSVSRFTLSLFSKLSATHPSNSGGARGGPGWAQPTRNLVEPTRESFQN
jgi:hypothetical protein